MSKHNWAIEVTSPWERGRPDRYGGHRSLERPTAAPVRAGRPRSQGLVAAVLCFACLFGAPRCLSGATFADSEFLIDSWQTEQGLPENSATAMVQTPDGYLWFGTFAGLVRFDGVRFTVFDPSNTPALPSPGIVNLHLDASGRLWVSTYRGIVVRDGDRWTAYGRDQGWTGTMLGPSVRTRE